MKKNKNNQKSTVSDNSTFTTSKFLFLLYLFTGFIPSMGAMDYDGPEWLYVSVLNVVVLFFIAKNYTFFNAFSFHKNFKTFLFLFLGFFTIGCVSIFNAINVSESLVHLSRLVNIIVALYCLYLIIRQNPRYFFNFTCKAVTIILAYFAGKAILFFIGNYSSPRTHGFLKLFPHNYGNMNIYAAYLAIQFPFVVYGFIYFKKVWKYISGVVVLMVILALFFASARTALLSTSIIFFLFIAYLVYGVVKHKLPFKREIAILLILPILSGFLVLNVNRLDKSSSNSIQELLVSREADFFKGRDAVKSGADNLKDLIPKAVKIETKKQLGSERFTLWNLAFLRFKENPILGVGYGNYKAIGKKEHYANFSHREGLFMNPRRAHNDFIEKLAETGILGFLLYVSLFVFPFILFVKMFRREKQYEKRFILVVILGSAIVYTLDALLNFPLERPPVQLYFLLVAVFILLFSRKETFELQKTSNGKLHLVFFGCVFLISFATIASNYLVFKSYQLQRTMREDLSGKTLFTDQKLKNSYASIKKKWTDYPQLSYIGTVNNVYLANYAVKAKKYEEALEILNRSENYNKDAFLVKAFKAEIYLNAYDNIDSATYYAENVFKDYPGFRANYDVLRKVYLKEEDTVNLMRVMDRYSKKSPRDAVAWKQKANTIYSVTKDSKRMLAVIDTALAYNANSYTLLLAKKEVLDKLKFKSHLSDAEIKAKHQTAYGFFAKQQYQKAREVYLSILKTNPNDYLSVQNIGIINLIEKKYEAAIVNLTRVIDAKVFPDGKAEYSRGYCYEQLGQLSKAKADYRISRAKKYPQAMSLPETKYK
ncbi:O-antigen ligase family protein [Kordia jejudonensis]|uniref:O-antigen ligase family protein n=1 Tax=Kordia jejudonensis TaxID=1348245 RepID=UPI000629B2AA|nr:O-antigen ligase family protein [Kordia jejudonensis]